MVEVDVTARHFRPGKPNYDRVKWSLANHLSREEKFAISWHPTGSMQLSCRAMKVCASILRLAQA